MNSQLLRESVELNYHRQREGLNNYTCIFYDNENIQINPYTFKERVSQVKELYSQIPINEQKLIEKIVSVGDKVLERVKTQEQRMPSSKKLREMYGYLKGSDIDVLASINKNKY